jgi:hypothetical protein
MLRERSEPPIRMLLHVQDPGNTDKNQGRLSAALLLGCEEVVRVPGNRTSLFSAESSQLADACP